MLSYLGEIIEVAFGFVPPGYAACDGSLLAIADNPPLFTLIGTLYGGDGQNDFALPDRRARDAARGVHSLIAVQGLFPLHPGDADPIYPQLH